MINSVRTCDQRPNLMVGECLTSAVNISLHGGLEIKIAVLVILEDLVVVLDTVAWKHLPWETQGLHK